MDQPPWRIIYAAPVWCNIPKRLYNDGVLQNSDEIVNIVIIVVINDGYNINDLLVKCDHMSLDIGFATLKGVPLLDAVEYYYDFVGLNDRCKDPKYLLGECHILKKEYEKNLDDFAKEMIYLHQRRHRNVVKIY